MKEILLNVQIREKGSSSKKELSEMRKVRLIPAVVYGGKKPPLTVMVHAGELTQATKAGGANAILHLKHPKGEDTVILKAMQRHAVSNLPTHADFQRISLKEKIEVKVPLHVVGEAPGVKLHGGILEHILRELKVRAIPTAIPQRIDVDVSALDLNQSITVKDIKVPEDIEVLDSAEHLVINVVQPVEEAAPAPAEGAAAAEPEVIAKGKKDEEGASEGEAKKGEGDAKAKGAAPTAPAGEKKKEASK